MIDFAQFRAVTGLYNGRYNTRSGRGIHPKGNHNVYAKNQYSNPSAFNPYNRPGPMKFFNCDNSGSWSEFIIHAPPEDVHHSLHITFYSYIMLLLILIMLSIISSHTFTVTIPQSSLPYIRFQISILSLMHIKIGYFCIFQQLC